MARNRDIDVVDEERSDDELEDLVEHGGSSGTLGFIGGLLLGAVIGAGIALLVAPERGEVVRRHIRTRVQDMQDGARDRLDDWREEAGAQLRRKRRKLRRRLKARH